MAVNDIAIVRVVCSMQDQVSINVRHYRQVGTDGAGATYQAFADSVAGALAPWYKALMADVAFFEGVAVTILPVAGPPNLEFQSQSGAGPGDLASDPLPKQVSGLISLRSALGGRRGRGRLYVPFPAEESNSNISAPNTDYVDALNDLGGELLNPRNVGGAPDVSYWVPVLFARDTVSTSDLVSFSPRARWATQKRRGDFGKPNQSPIV